VIIGAQKAGTTSLWRYLIDHPRVVAPALKELHFFDIRYARGLRWYRAQFPLRSSVARRNLVTFEASPYYLAHPLVPGRMQETLPDVKLVALLRDPVARAWSHYRHNAARGAEPLPFVDALRAEDGRLEPGRERLERGLDPGRGYRTFGYVDRGRYDLHLERWFAAYPREQILLLDSDRFFDDTTTAYTSVLEFVGIDASPQPPAFDVHNTNPGDELDVEARAFLEAAFAEPNRVVAATTGIDFAAARRRDDHPSG